ncbi:hypothetical protein FFWV33_17130 [Flavobacterium faecale]|uniref:Lipoprotein n=1 Tax=Flavobacterium faecale TaxID=1355330 RepID=A0A2S1LHE8_9FLAO|nr:DUF6565 domain-containing protein [Flavobacterium faecale]AWG23128.1 hypothetical protein FFWV33_17130 [Flavobacterium faecale]
MKKISVAVMIASTALFFTSCKNEQQENAEKKVEAYNHYIDSVSTIAEAEASKDWEAIDARYTTMKADADMAITTASDKDKIQAKLDEASMKYDAFKMKVVEQQESVKNEYNKTLFGSAYVSDDMQFNWVNKDNILSVYQNFVDTVQKNKDSYSREDWDKIKLAYEALDSRKNTVENEGLTGADNRKIALLKLKFAPMYTVNRMGAKSEENAEAKK